MTKHRLSPEVPDNLPHKRLHTSSSLAPSHAHATSLATLYDEIILAIFSFLSFEDLCAVQRTNRNWSRLALDNQLWRSLYLNEFGRARLRGGRGFIGRADGREIKPLPSRVRLEDQQNDPRDWKWMFRISSNWRRGRCSTETVLHGGNLSSSPSGSLPPQEQLHGRQILLAGSLLVATTRDDAGGPALSLVSPSNIKHTISCKTSRSDHSTQITALALDQSQPTSSHHVRLAAFFSTGEFMIVNIDHFHPSQSRQIIYQSLARGPRTAPIVRAAYHGRLLVTLSQSFRLSLYDMSSDSIQHTQTLSSFTSYPPSSMVLTPTSPTTYKLILAYTTPVFPAHWSVGATELIIASDGSMTVSSSRTIGAMDIPSGWMDDQKMRSVREQWSRKVENVADTQTDGKWVVLAPYEASPATNTSKQDATALPADAGMHSPSSLQLYRLHLPASVSGASNPKLTFVRTLHGQIGPVIALALADGRCVSLGANGSIWVWDLEAASGTEVCTGCSSAVSMHGGFGDETSARSNVVFDERRIISADLRGVEVRRFDI